MDRDSVDDRLRKLAKASPNFGRLYGYQPLLAIYGSQAELTAITVIGQDGEVEKEDIQYDRDDFTATTTNKQLNFLQHIMSLTAVGGRAAVVLPDSPVTRSTSTSRG